MDLIPLDDDDLPLMRAVVTGSTVPPVSADPGNAIEQRDDGLFVPVSLTAQQVQAMIDAAIEAALGNTPTPVVSLIASNTTITSNTIIEGSA